MTYTIGMISSYVGLKPCPIDWLWQQAKHPFGKWDNIQIQANAKNPDFLLMYNFHDFPEALESPEEPASQRSVSPATSPTQSTTTKRAARTDDFTMA
jgi:hypothetical protein